MGIRSLLADSSLALVLGFALAAPASGGETRVEIEDAPAATIFSPFIVASGAPGGTNLDRVWVRTAHSDDDEPADAAFTVMVFCAE